MEPFTNDEIGLIDKLATGKKLSEEEKDAVAGLKEKLDARTQSEIVDRFVAVTGWTNRPKDYPL